MTMRHLVLRHPDAGEHIAAIEAATDAEAVSAAISEAAMRRGGDAERWAVHEGPTPADYGLLPPAAPAAVEAAPAAPAPVETAPGADSNGDGVTDGEDLA